MIETISNMIYKIDGMVWGWWLIILPVSYTHLDVYKRQVFYTGHCTGREAFEMMKEVMGDQLFWIHSGDRIV